MADRVVDARDRLSRRGPGRYLHTNLAAESMTPVVEPIATTPAMPPRPRTPAPVSGAGFAAGTAGSGVAIGGKELPALALPVWMTSWPALKDRLAYFAKYLGRLAVHHGVRSPLYLGRASVPVGKGIAATAKWWWHWIRAKELMEGDKRDPRAAIAERNARWKSMGIGAGVGAAALAYATYKFGVVAPVATVAAAVTGLGVIGYKIAGAPTILDAQMPSRPLEAGMPAKALAATIDAAFEEIRLSAKVIRVMPTTWGWEVEVFAEQAIAGLVDKLDQIENKLRTRRGAVTIITDKEDAGRAVMRIVHGDPFMGMSGPAAYAPRSQTITRPAALGRAFDAAAVSVSLCRVHMGIVGGTGAGKSSMIWTLADYLTACQDAVVWGVDLSGAPALNAWGDCIQEFADTKEKARILLEGALQVARNRSRLLGQRSRPTLEAGMPTGDENWTPTPDAPALVIVIDEFPILVDAGLFDLVLSVMREGRKGAVTVILGAQSAKKDELGSTTVKAMMGARVLLACAPGDVDLLLGPGSRAQGWAADRLVPSDSVVPNDAGRFYVRAGGLAEPKLSATHRLELSDIWRRALDRMKAGLPQIDRPSLAGVDLSSTESAASSEAPQVLQDLAAVFADAHAERMPTAEVIAALCELDADRYAPGFKAEKLADMLRPLGIKSGQLGDFDGSGRNPRGYRLDHITAVLAPAAAR